MSPHFLNILFPPKIASTAVISLGKKGGGNLRIVRLTYDTGVMKGSLDDTNASITPKYPQKLPCHPFIPLPTRITNPE
jgi:hypothetical protein